MKRVALINDLSGFGKCSLTAAIPVISVMGIQACPLPTAILSAQSEFEHYFCDDLTDKMDNITEQWKKMEVSFDGIYSGYLASPLQIEKVLYFLEQFEQENTLYLADPVMGDDGKGYDVYNEEFLCEMKKLTAKASVITPNLTELCFLTGENYFELITHRQDTDYIERIQKLCIRLAKQALRPQTIIVTGIIRKADNKEYVGTLAVTAEDKTYIETSYSGKSFSGTGDLFASVICGSLMKGIGIQEALEKATHFLQLAIEDATTKNVPLNHGVEFEKYLSALM